MRGGVTRNLKGDWEVGERPHWGKCVYLVGLCCLARCGAVTELREVNLHLALSSALTMWTLVFLGPC